jgi:hypothetical protein
MEELHKAWTMPVRRRQYAWVLNGNDLYRWPRYAEGPVYMKESPTKLFNICYCVRGKSRWDVSAVTVCSLTSWNHYTKRHAGGTCWCGRWVGHQPRTSHYVQSGGHGPEPLASPGYDGRVWVGVTTLFEQSVRGTLLGAKRTVSVGIRGESPLRIGTSHRGSSRVNLLGKHRPGGWCRNKCWRVANWVSGWRWTLVRASADVSRDHQMYYPKGDKLVNNRGMGESPMPNQYHVKFGYSVRSWVQTLGISIPQ